MKSIFRNFIVLLSFLVLINIPAFSQLSFPNSTDLNLVTNTSILYFETEVLFHTGKYNVDDYDWIKVSDSVDANWFIIACFNGDCWGNIPDSGRFIKEYGFNDTTGFIRFHVDCYEMDGTSTIKYMVKNYTDKTDNKILTFRITYKKTVGIEDFKQGNSNLTFYDADGLKILNDLSINEIPTSIQIFDINGKLLSSFNKPSGDIILNLEKGIYLLVVNNEDERLVRKLKI